MSLLPRPKAAAQPIIQRPNHSLRSKYAVITIATLLIFSVAVIVQVGAVASATRAIDIEIRLPTGGKPHFVIPEGEGMILPLPDRRQYGFVPVVRDNTTPPIVVVGIWDVQKKSVVKLGEVEAVLGGPAVISDTTPQFAIRILRIAPQG